MLKITEAQGHWWVPNDPAVKPSGRLNFNSTNGGSIALWGPRLGIPPGDINFAVADHAPWFFDRIFGETDQGYITALDCRVLSSSFSPGSRDTKQIIECRAIIKGIHVESGTLFCEARAQIVNFDDWATFTTVRRDGSGGYAVVTSPGLQVSLDDCTELHLLSTVTSGHGPKSAHIEIHNQLRLEFQNPITYQDVISEWINPFVDLVTLATARPSAIEKLELSDGRSELGQLWHEVGLGLGYDPIQRSAPIWAREPLLAFSDLDASQRIPLWYDMSGKLRGIFNYTFGARYSTDISPENRYLSATTAAEAIHREMVRSKRKKVDLEDANLRAFADSFPEDERKLLRDRLAHLNDESFHERLQHLYHVTRPISEKLAPNGARWIVTVKKTRNALTHQSGRLRSEIVSGEKLGALAESLFLLITVFILVELGYSTEAIEGWLERQHRGRTIIGVLHSYFPELIRESSTNFG